MRLSDLSFGAVAANALGMLVMVIASEEDYDDTVCVILKTYGPYEHEVGQVGYQMGDGWELIDG